MCFSKHYNKHEVISSSHFKIEDFFDKEFITTIITICKDILNVNSFLFDDNYNIFVNSKRSNIILEKFFLEDQNFLKNYVKSYYANGKLEDKDYTITEVYGFAVAIVPLKVNNYNIGTFVIVDNSKGFFTSEKIKYLCESKDINLDRYITEFYSLSDYDEKRLNSIAVLYQQYFCFNRNFKALQQVLNVQGFLVNSLNLTLFKGSIKDTMLTACKTLLDIFNIDAAAIVLLDTSNDKKVEFVEESYNNYILKDLMNNKIIKSEFNAEGILYEIETYLSEKVFYYKTYNLYIKDKTIGYIFLINEHIPFNINSTELTMIKNIIKLICINYEYKVSNINLSEPPNCIYSILDYMNLGVYIKKVKSEEVVYVNKCFLQQFELDSYVDNKDINFNKCLPKHINLTNEEGDYYYKEVDKWFYKHKFNASWVDGEEVEVWLNIETTDIIRSHMTVGSIKWSNVLTCLPNRDKLLTDLDYIYKTNCKNYCFAVLNVDFFNRINFSYGYEYGDKFIIEITKFLKGLDKRYRTYHLGGSEFAIVIEGSDNIVESTNKILDRFKSPWIVDSVEQYCTASIGITKIPLDGKSPEIITQNAISALKRAKSTGRNRVCYFDSNVDNKFIKNTQLEYYLRSAVMKNIEYFKVYYQPIVETQTGKIVSVEALVRWFDPEIGFVTPDEFIGLAEYLGFISIIDNYVLEKACKFVKGLHDKGYYITVSVNLSINQLYDDKLTSSIKETIEKTGLDCSYVHLEVTENTAITDIPNAIRKLEELKELGIKVSLDDFGTGYSSLNILKNLPVDTVKIDKQFIRDIKKSKYNYTFIKTIIELAHSANLKVCCEGIETLEEWNNLKSLKCDTLQGYYFSRPLQEDKLLEKLMSCNVDNN